MKMSREDFLALQRYWYDRLQESGFEDAEKLVGGHLVLKEAANECYKGVDEISRDLKEEYYRLIHHNANSDEISFRNEIDRHILRRHSEGAMIKTIVEELEGKRDRRSVRIIIRRYEAAWGLRKYNRTELHLKKMK